MEQATIGMEELGGAPGMATVVKRIFVLYLRLSWAGEWKQHEEEVVVEVLAEPI
jgi:hypothetical protein